MHLSKSKLPQSLSLRQIVECASAPRWWIGSG